MTLETLAAKVNGLSPIDQLRLALRLLEADQVDLALTIIEKVRIGLLIQRYGLTTQ